MSDNGSSVNEIVEELDTTKSYVYRVRSESNDSEPEQTDQDEPTSNNSPESSKELPESDVTQGDIEDSGNSDMGIDDTGTKSYECGNCDAELEYLQKTCDNCGKKPAWSVIG